MARPTWKGHISFGLVNVPVTLYSGQRSQDTSFKLVDSRNSARVRYERVNEETGEEVPWDKIVKGFEYADGNFVLLTDDELEHASVKLTKTIEIEQFVELSEIPPYYFEKPYYLVPGKGGEKGYVLLREALAETGKVGIATVVIRTRQYLAALLAEGDALILNLLRFQEELQDIKQHTLPGHDLREHKISKKEVDLAKQLIAGMTEEWQPNAFHDEYREHLMKLVEKKVKSGETEVIADDDETEQESPGTINFLDVLQRSVKKTAKPAAKRATKKKAARKTSKKRRAS